MLDEKQKAELAKLLQACRNNLKSVNERLISNAFEFCIDVHKNDLRASGKPYYEHPLAVAIIMANELPIDDISVAAALLHDTLEHSELTAEDLAKEFNREIADIVDGVTKIGGVIKEHDVSQSESYRKLLLSMVKDLRVILVKFADRLHNMKTLEFLPKEKQEMIANETLQIYAPFAHRFGLGQIKWELEDLAFKYHDPEAYDEIKKRFFDTRVERENLIKQIIEPIRKKLEEEKSLSFEIVGRPKHFYSIYRKLKTRVSSFDEIFDLLAIRIILDTDNIYECYNVLGIVTNIFTPVPDRLHDYIALPKKNNYQSLHTTVVGPEGKMVEIQIRTRRMHEVAEKGVAAHWKYKNSSKASDKEVEEWVDWIRDLLEKFNTKENGKDELIDNFKLNLYTDEIYVFTPKGDLKVLPLGATPVDFAFEIHSKVGFHCIGAKVNNKIVNLDTKLQSGDQIEIITSKKQTPNRSWEKFVVTSKARQEIRKWIKSEDDHFIETGRVAFEKALKKHKITMNNDDLIKLAVTCKFDNLAEMYKAIATGKITSDKIFELKDQQKKQDQQTIEEIALDFEKFAKESREISGGILLNGTKMDVLHNFAKCCNPVPGDEVIGYITKLEGIKIHRKNCKNLNRLKLNPEGRIINVSWPSTSDKTFVSAIKILGEDRVGMLSDISQTIMNVNNTGIKSVNISTHKSVFYGTVSVLVQDLNHLNKIIEKLKKLNGVELVERFEVRH